MEERKSGLSTPIAIIIGSLIIATSNLLTGGVIKIKGADFKAGSLGAQVPAPSAAAQVAPAAAPEDTGPVKVSLDDDPVFGDKNAPVTMVEFSDYECPFCKRHFDEVYPELKKNYVDTGKMKIVFRDLPLSFHQNAHKEAEAADCSREQGGDATYFKFHDAMFTQTTSNGTGLALEKLPVIAKDLGLNVSSFQQCFDSGKYKDEVDKDLADASTIGASGTPTFFIGKSTADNSITATRLVGAQPYDSFKSVIEQQLSK